MQAPPKHAPARIQNQTEAGGIAPGAPRERDGSFLEFFRERENALIAGLSILGIFTHLVLRFGTSAGATVVNVPLFATLALGGAPLVFDLTKKLLRRQFGSDLLAGISTVG